MDMVNLRGWRFSNVHHSFVENFNFEDIHGVASKHECFFEGSGSDNKSKLSVFLLFFLAEKFGHFFFRFGEGEGIE
jgi:hypothetical protein